MGWGGRSYIPEEGRDRADPLSHAGAGQRCVHMDLPLHCKFCPHTHSTTPTSHIQPHPRPPTHPARAALTHRDLPLRRGVGGVEEHAVAQHKGAVSKNAGAVPNYGHGINKCGEGGARTLTLTVLVPRPEPDPRAWSHRGIGEKH